MAGQRPIARTVMVGAMRTPDCCALLDFRGPGARYWNCQCSEPS
jgi:hypothetical protein